MIRSVRCIHQTVFQKRRLGCRSSSSRYLKRVLACSPSGSSTHLGPYPPSSLGTSTFLAATTERCFSSERSTASTDDEEDSKDDERSFFGTAKKSLGDHGQVETDFFGEPVTFLGLQKEQNAAIVSQAMAALDGFLLGVVSKGRTCVGGGQEGGLAMQAAHSVALQWSEALRHAAVWNEHPAVDTAKDDGKLEPSAPMLALVTVAPVLVQTGLAYVQHLDSLLAHAKPGPPGLPTIQLERLARSAASQKDNEQYLTLRERLHLQALDYLLQSTNSGHATALTVYLKILELCPGDVLALSQAMDLCWVLGDKASALRASGSVASYWNERRGGWIRPSLPGHTLASSLMALGFAVGGRDEYAEIMADRCLTEGRKICGAIATWAQCHVFDVRGRTSEGISAMANFDGVANYEGAGFLFFDARLGGYGGRFSLDREQRGRGKSAALRLYGYNLERVLEYSGFAQGLPWDRPLHKAPLAWTERKALDGGEIQEDAKPSFMDRLMGRTTEKEESEQDFDLIIKQINNPSTEVGDFEPVLEDVLTWLPPTPGLLVDSTLLLMRCIFNGTISVKSARWDYIRNAWKVMLEVHEKHAGSGAALAFYPLASVVSSLLFPPSRTGGDQIGNGRLAEGLYMMGELLKLGNPVTEAERNTSIREIIADTDPNFWLPIRDDAKREEWTKIVQHFVAARNGMDFATGDGNEKDAHANVALRFQCWDFEARPILEHALVYAACRSGDTESLCVARSICSQGVSLRQVSPEEWWRYSIVLGLLGDVTGSEDALENSINFGGGQGQRA